MSRFTISIPKVKRAGVRLRVSEGGVAAAKNIASPAAARDHFDELRSWAREALVAFLLDQKNNLIDAELISIGTIDSSAVYPREVARVALEAGAASIVLAHNHPSGDPEPSLCDREVTRDMVFALSLLQIKVLDHVIVGSGQRYWSFADHGLIEDYSYKYQESIASASKPRAWVTP